LKKNLLCVCGWDVDSVAIKECIANLNALIKEKNIDIKWNICVANSIKNYEKSDLFCPNEMQKFDYIVGNPPYIRIQHLDAEQRQFVQNNYDFCKSGSTDIYIAFYELCLNLLADRGICGLITPNTFLFTETARQMRLYFATNKNLLQITNYGDIQLFENATTYSAITIFNKKENENFKFQKALTEQNFEEKIINFAELQEPFWQLTTEKNETIKGIKLKDICNIHVGITTLCDSAYIFSIEDIDGNYASANTKFKGKIKIEKSILKPIVKGSKLKHSEEKIKEYVLFPYNQVNGKHIIMPEKELKENYPLTYNYLLSVKPELDKRDNGVPNSVS
jgi:type I restriction-modification system DNA methylase subunit